MLEFEQMQNRPLNLIWAFFIGISIILGAYKGKLAEVSKAMISGTETAVTLAIGLIGIMAFWLGLVKVLEMGGALDCLSRVIRPLMVRLFPSVPADHPAMSYMTLNMSANALGLNNAATPFGLKAMEALDDLNREKGTASNSMALFLAMNTSGIVFFPTSMIAIRTGLGASSPASIFMTTLLAQGIGFIFAIGAAKFLQNLPGFRVHEARAPRVVVQKIRKAREPLSLEKIFAVVLSLGIIFFVIRQTIRTERGFYLLMTDWLLPILVGLLVLWGISKKIPIYDSVVEGGKEALGVAAKIVPYLVAMLAAISMFRACGAMDILAKWLAPMLSWIGMPAEVLPMAILRPLSGSGSLAIASDIMKAHGPDSLIGNMAATLYGSSETTFYVLAVYFGVVGIKNGRHTLAACLLADVVGTLATIWVCQAWLG